MKFLLDTNVISTLAPSNKERAEALADWLHSASDRLYLSVVTVAEIKDGIAKLTREGASQKAAALSDWWNAVEHLYASRILPFDLSAATIAGRLNDIARGAGHTPGFADVAIAATAQAHDLIILTRNVRHFAPMGIRVINPFDGLPSIS